MERRQGVISPLLGSDEPAKAGCAGCHSRLRGALRRVETLEPGAEAVVVGDTTSFNAFNVTSSHMIEVLWLVRECVRGCAGVTTHLNELNQGFSLAVRPPSESGALARNKHQIQVGGLWCIAYLQTIFFQVGR